MNVKIRNISRLRDISKVIPYRQKALRLLFIFIFSLLLFGILPALEIPFGIKVAQAVDVTIDATTSTTSNDHKNQPALVFANDTVGYMFYRETTGTCGYRKTTNGGNSWSGYILITAQTDCVGISIWYDRWTPGDESGTFIHMVFIETGTDNVYYERLNTSDDSQLGEVAVDQTFNTLSNVDNIAITKGTTDVLYIGMDDANMVNVSKVMKCSTNCSSTGGWSNAGSSPLEQTNDPIRLMPLGGGDILLIRNDISLDDIQSKVYNATGGTWDGSWTTIDANAPDSTTYRETIASTVDEFTNDIYLAYGADIYATTAIAAIRSAVYNGSAWVIKTDVINATNTIISLDIARDENTGDVYVAYLRGTRGSSQMNAYYKKSTNSMSSWSAETKFNTNNNLTDMRWMYLNRISNERIYGVYFQNTGGNDGLFGNTLVDLIDTTPPTVVSNTNIMVQNNSFLDLNASIYDSLGVKNATVNISSVNSTLAQAILTKQGNYWINNTIIGNKETVGYANMTITAYDVNNNLNNNTSMSVLIDSTPPIKVDNFTNITSPSYESVYVSWNASTDIGGSGIKLYTIERFNDSFNFLSIPRPIINASDIRNGYKDAYRYTFKSNAPVNCTICHLSKPASSLANFYAKYNESYLYMAIHTPDNDTLSSDDKIRIGFDVNMDGGTLPNTDDRLYQITENNTLTFYKGNGSGWVLNTTNAVSYVNNPGISSYWYEIRIPLSEIGSPVNNTSINFLLENECNPGGSFLRKESYFPMGADEDNPGTWKTITFRNYTDYKFVANSTFTQSIIRDLNSSYYYNFTVRAIDNVLNYGPRSDPLTIQTAEDPSYNITGFLLNAITTGLQGEVSIQNYRELSNSSGGYHLTEIPNGTYMITGTAAGYQSNSTTVVVSGSNLTNINITLYEYDPPLVISNTNNVYFFNNRSITLNATITDIASGVKNATVNVSSVNSTINEAMLTLQGGFWVNNTIIADKGETIDFVDLTITAYDNVGNVNQNVNMTVWILLPPTIISWSNNITNDQSLNLKVFINESILFNVTADRTVNYNWTYDTIDQVQDFDNFSQNFSGIGLHYVNATIRNGIGTDNKNWTINVVYKPDLVMTAENISFSFEPSEVENGEVKENVNVTLNATVYNSGLGDASDVNISFYDGYPGPGNNIANVTISNISAGGSQNASIYWNSIIGTHNISIEVDPENTLVETDDENNRASKTINVSAWQKYYGNLSGNLSLSDKVGNSLTDWSWATQQGNIFITNISYFEYNNLQALGRKKNGTISQNNFLRADELLNIIPGINNATGFLNNNITELFSSNGTSPRNYTNFTVYGRKIEYVAIVNSTNTTNYKSVETSTFVTGILWDTTKDNGDGDYGDDGEELAFIAGINVGKTGLGNSSHDYEIAIPSIIRSEGNVYFFVELK